MSAGENKSLKPREKIKTTFRTYIRAIIFCPKTKNIKINLLWGQTPIGCLEIFKTSQAEQGHTGLKVFKSQVIYFIIFWAKEV